MQCEFKHPDGGGCQFHKAPLLENWNGHLYCGWHLPLDRKMQWEPARREKFAMLVAGHIATLAEQRGKADFAGIFSLAPLTLDGHSFVQVDLRKAHLEKGLSLKDATITDSVILDGASIGGYSFLDSSTIGALSVLEATITGNISFSGATIEGDTEIARMTCGGIAMFRGTTFEGRTLFDRVQFASAADFGSTRFLDPTHFSDVAFAKGVMFEAACFEKLVNFENVHFRAHSEFRRAHFKEAAVFRTASFYGYAGFHGAVFEKEAMFDAFAGAVHALPFSTWKEAKFRGVASFENREFSTQGNFENAEFVRAPIFHGCTFHGAMVFPLESAFKERAGAEAAQAYRTLRLAMEKLSARIEVGQFFALEQESLRNTPGRLRRNEWAISWLYGKLSDYGRNALKPMLVLACTILAFSGIYALSATPLLAVSADLDLDLLWRSLVFSIQQTVQPFWVWRQPTETVLLDLTPLYVAPIATIQSIASLVLVSLTLLAIRWRFKRE